MAAKYKQTFFKTKLRHLMAVTASIFLSLIFKRMLEMFSLAQTIKK